MKKIIYYIQKNKHSHIFPHINQSTFGWIEWYGPMSSSNHFFYLLHNSLIFINDIWTGKIKSTVNSKNFKPRHQCFKNQNEVGENRVTQNPLRIRPKTLKLWWFKDITFSIKLCFFRLYIWYGKDKTSEFRCRKPWM